MVKVAICQPVIVSGGRLNVILDIVEMLNDAGIVPDVLTTRFALRFEDIEQKYGRSVKLRLQWVPRVPRLPQEFGNILFNGMLKRYASSYDLLINTSNSLIFLPKSTPVITYMFYPRKHRIMADVVDLHRPDSHFSLWSKMGVQRLLLRWIYRLSKPHSNHHVICMTEFTRAALQREYPTLSDLPIIYPKVDTAQFWSDRRDRNPAVVSVGRFAASKRQLEQIKLAATLPDMPFHIIGFANQSAYYQQCERYVQQNQLDNVHLLANLSFERMIQYLQTSKFFLHSLINEPFGLTAAEAIAAGCLPIVHDSGGQREVVVVPELRYRDLSEVSTILDWLEEDDALVDHLIIKLQKHITSNFTKEHFKKRMHAILAPYLG